MSDSEKVATYISRHFKWTDELQQLRDIFQKTELKEEIKWGSPTYTLNGKLVAGMAAFKNHYALWFHQGVFLKDLQKQLVNAQEGITKALRQWRFEKGDPIDESLVLQYIHEAIQNSLAGKELKPQRKEGVTIPPLFSGIFKKDPSFEKSFKKLSPGKQREYAAYLTEAKRDATRQSRLEKILPMIKEGKGLYDAYKKN